MVPVVDGARRVQGIITDRDICMATATRHRKPEDLAVGEVMNSHPRTVQQDEDVRTALELMRSEPGERAGRAT